MSEISKAAHQSPDDRGLDGELTVMELNKAQGQIKAESAWLNGDRNAMTLFKSDGLRIVLMALHTGAELKAHKAPGIITVQVLEGEIIFKTEKQESTLGKGEMLTLHHGVTHSVLAVREAVFLLTIAISN